MLTGSGNLLKSDGTTLIAAQAASFVSDRIAVSGARTWKIELIHAGTGTPVGLVTVEGGLTSAGMQAITLPVAMSLDPATNTILFFGEVDPAWSQVQLRWTRTSGTMTPTSARYEVI